MMASLRDRVTSLLFARPDDEQTEAGRARGRMRRVLLSMGASSVARAVSMATGVIALPLTAGYLGDERFGLWSVISSLSLALNFADLGLGNSLVNTLADAYGRGDQIAARRQVSTSFFLSVTLATLLLFVFWLAYPYVDWQRLFKVRSVSAAAEVGPALWCFVFCLALGLVTSIVSRVELAYQNGFGNGMWQAVGSVASLGALWTATRWRVGLPALVLVLTGVPVLTTVCQAIYVFFVTRPGLRPSVTFTSVAAARNLLRLGMGYLVVQVAMALSMYSDSLIATNRLGPQASGQLNVLSKPFALISATLFMALVPMWPAYTEALAKRDFAWVKRTLKRSTAFVLVIAGAPGILLLFVGPWLIRWWMRKPDLDVPVGLLAALAAWTLVQAIGGVWAALMNGMALIRFQAIVAVTTAIVAFSAKIFFVQRAGVIGLVWGTAVAHAIFTLIPIGLYMRYSLNKRAAVAAAEAGA